jgi:hypothetical protein
MPQTLFHLSLLRDHSGPRVIGRSPGVSFETEEWAMKVAVQFGDCPPGQRCPATVFTVDDRGTLIVVKAGSLPGDGSPLVFRMFGIDARDRLGFDALAWADSQPLDAVKGELMNVEWTATFPPRRTVDQIRTILKAGDSPLLLGSVQALLDGCKIAVSRAEAGPNFVDDVWRLLPDKSKVEINPATFAYSAALGFDIVVLPDVPANGIPGYLSAEQVREYPEGRYELALQHAAENGNQAELDRLFARKTSREVLRLAIGMVVFALVVVLILKLF